MERTIQITRYEGLGNFSASVGKLIAKSREALRNAYVPYSGFRVGAAIYLENGVFVQGCNQENRAFPSGLCAERTALFSAGSLYPDQPIKGLALYSEDGGDVNVMTPCGACRQVMFEFQQKQKTPFPVYLAGKNEEVWYVEDVENLLPFPFVPKVNNA